jgi:hypothetical protein
MLRVCSTLFSTTNLAVLSQDSEGDRVIYDSAYNQLFAAEGQV